MVLRVWQLTLHDLRVRRSALAGWCVALALTVIAFVAMYPSIEKLDFEKVAAQYPAGLLKAFGINSISQLSTAGGFLNLELFGAILPLTLIFLPIGMISHAITNDEDRGYLGALLALPLARGSVMAAAAASAVAAQLLAIFAIVASAMLASVIGGAGLTFHAIFESSVSTLPLGAFAAGIAVVTAGLSRRRGLPTAVAGGVLIAMYLLQVLGSFSSFFHDIRGISAFNYYNAWINSGIDWLAWVILLAVSVALMVAGAALFSRRDVG
jgi:putative exporter of polyketide antibiotics